MATIRDVAELAGVSVATVSAVINQDSGVNVSDRLTKRVEEAIKKLNYRPNRIARALSKMETHTLAYMVPSITNHFFSRMANYIEDYAFQRGYGVYLCNTHSRKDRAQLYIDNLIENRVSGVILTLTWEVLESNLVKNLLSEHIPVIGLAGARSSADIDTVTIDDTQGAKLATTYLIKLGHTWIGFIGAENSRTTEIRLKGYRQALDENNIKQQDSLIELGNGFSREEGYRLAENLLNRNEKMTAFFVYNDEMASGVLDKLNELDIRIPEDIAVIGFDDSVAEHLKPKLTTMAIPKEEMVSLAMEMLFDRFTDNSIKPRHKKVIPELIIRDSA